MLQKLKSFTNTHQQQLAYGLSGFSASLLITQFGLFNVALFTTVVQLNPNSFYLGHIIYALWNAVNDPAFGWLIDKTGTRLEIIQYGGPLWAACFLVTWFPWSYDGESWLAFFHFLFSMFCFDGFLTFVLIVKCALLADLCVSSQARNELNSFSAWFSLLGSSLAMTTWYVWDVNNLNPFRTCSVVLCIFSGITWYISGKLMKMPKSNHSTQSEVFVKRNGKEMTEMERDTFGRVMTRARPANMETEMGENQSLTNTSEMEKKCEDMTATELRDFVNKKSDSAATTTTSQASISWTSEFMQWWSFVKELIRQPPFIQYVSLNWLMNFNYFLSDSFLVFLDQKLMSKVMPPWYRLVITTLSLYLPKFGVQLMTPYANKYGLHGK